MLLMPLFGSKQNAAFVSVSLNVNEPAPPLEEDGAFKGCASVTVVIGNGKQCICMYFKVLSTSTTNTDFKVHTHMKDSHKKHHNTLPI